MERAGNSVLTMKIRREDLEKKEAKSESWSASDELNSYYQSDVHCWYCNALLIEADSERTVIPGSVPIHTVKPATGLRAIRVKEESLRLSKCKAPSVQSVIPSIMLSRT